MPFQPSEMSEATLKRFVDNLARFIKSNPLSEKPKRAQLQEAVASMLGWSDYHHAITTLRNSTSGSPTSSPKIQAMRSEWTVPVPLGEVNRFVRFGELFFNQSTSNQSQFTMPASDFAALVMLWAKEKNRRHIFHQLMEANPGKPILLISSSGSLLSTPQFPSASPNSSHLSFAQLLATDPAEEIIDLINSGVSSASGIADMWVSRASSLVHALIPALVYQRDTSSQNLTVDHLISSLDIENIIKMGNASTLPVPVRTPLLEYAQSLPGYNPNTVVDTLREQHSYLSMQVIPVVRALARQESFVLPGSGLPANCQLVLADSPSTSDVARLGSAINDWVSRHPGGMVFLDLLPLSDDLWNMVLRSQAHWTDAGAALWIGAGLRGDIPENIRPRLLGRCQETLSDGAVVL